jgi:hypothetical protein
MSGIPHEQIHARFERLPIFEMMEQVLQWLSRAQEHGQISKDGNPAAWCQVVMGTLHHRAMLVFSPDHRFAEESKRFNEKIHDDESFIQSAADLLWKGMAESEG